VVAPRREVLLPPLHRQTARNGVSYLYRQGAGAPVVFLHGIGSRGESFRELIEALGPSAAVIAWDAPGYGASTPLAEDWPLAERYAEALEALLEELRIERAILVGHSLGTLMAASHARHFAQRLSGLVLMSPALGFGAPAGGPMPEAARARLDEFEKLGPMGYAAKRAAQLVHDAATWPGLVEELAHGMASLRQPGYGQAVRMLASGRLLDDVARTPLPCLILCGEEDAITPPAMAQRVEAVCRARPVIADTRLALVPKAGHMVYLEATEAVALHLRDFARAI
jgi:pimeloyl-ACP methyl ester carboxylesterase